MNSNIDSIIRDYTEGRKTLEEANTALKEAGASVYLAPRTEEELAEKRQREDAEGYIQPEEPPAPIQKRPDMSRRLDLAGRPKWEREIVQSTAIGRFRVEYDDEGYAVSAMRLGGTAHE